MIENFEIKAPEIDEQIEIASILSSLDDKIELNLQMNQTLEAMAQAIFKEWFVNFNFPGFDGELVDGLPKGWRMGKIKNVCEIKYGKDHKHLEEGKIPVYGSGGIMRYADQAIYNKHSILIPRKGTLSNLFYVSNPFWSVDTMFYTIIKSQYLQKYLFYLLKSLNLASRNVGSAVPSLTTEVLNKIEIVIPDDRTLKAFELLVSSFYSKMDENTNQIQTLTQIRDSLLPRLMTGKIEIQA
jgi:type I restriction enzyme S subunit